MTVRKIKSIGDIPYPIDVGADALSTLLTAGAALGITGDGPTETAAWLQRTSTSDGPTTAKSIHGNTVRWNQLAPAPDSELWTATGITSSVSGGVITLVPTSAAATYRRMRGVFGAITLLHKYLIAGTVDSTGIVEHTCSLGIYDNNGQGSTRGGITIQAGVARAHYAQIITPSSGSDLTFCVALSASSTSTESVTLENVMCIDLTALYGAGNEPATVAEFEALYPADYYPYDAGSLLPVNMTGIETEDANGDPLQTRSIPAGTLRGAGTAYDELTETQAITRIGEVDLGTLTWTKVNDGRLDVGYYFKAVITNAAQDLNRVCAKYDMATVDTLIRVIQVYGSGVDHLMFGAGTTSHLIIDSTYSTAEAFATAMNGVMLHYALATPTTVEIDPPLNLTYRTEQGGTERVLIPAGETSAPPTIIAASGYTAESLRDAALSAIAPVENGLASDNYAVGAYLVHGGQLCKVTTAIATGESITIGTNVTATTVMAEILSLVQ